MFSLRNEAIFKSDLSLKMRILVDELNMGL